MQGFYGYATPTMRVSYDTSFITPPPPVVEVETEAEAPALPKVAANHAACLRFGNELLNGNTALGLRNRFDTQAIYAADPTFWDSVMDRGNQLVNLRLMVPAATGVIAFTDRHDPMMSQIFWQQVIDGQCGTLGTRSAAWKHREWLRLSGWDKGDQEAIRLEQAIHSLGRFAAFVNGVSKMRNIPSDLSAAMAAVVEATAKS